MRLGVIVEGDQFVYKTDKWKLDWEKAVCWPYDMDKVESTYPFFINTSSMDKAYRKKAIGFELAAMSAGFELLHRREKLYESSRESHFTGGSTAIMGALAELLANHVDILIVHAGGGDAAMLLRNVMEHHLELRVTIVTSKPSAEMSLLLQDFSERASLVDPNTRRDEVEFTGKNSVKAVADKVDLDGMSSILSLLTSSDDTLRPRRMGRVGDFANTYGWALSCGSDWGGLFTAKNLYRYVPRTYSGGGPPIAPAPESNFWIVPTLDNVSEDRNAGIEAFRESGWTVYTPPVLAEGALDDGIIGVCLARCSHICENVLLLSGDKDFVPVLRLLKQAHGTKFHLIAPPRMVDPYNCTSKAVVKSKNAEFIPIQDILDELYYVPVRRWPTHLSSGNKPRNNNGKKQFMRNREEFRKKELERIKRIIKHRMV